MFSELPPGDDTVLKYGLEVALGEADLLVTYGEDAGQEDIVVVAAGFADGVRGDLVAADGDGEAQGLGFRLQHA